MKPKTESNNISFKTILTVLFVILVASLITLVYVMSRKVVEIPVLSTTRTIQAGSKLYPDVLTWEKKTPEQITPGMITKTSFLNRVIGEKAQVTIPAGSPILIQNITFISGGIPAKLLDEGRFAVAINLPRDFAISRLISEGDKIDFVLLWTMDAKIYSKTILQYIKVLKVSPSYPDEEVSESKQSSKFLPTTLVLAMDAEQIKQLMLAEKVGSLRMILSSAYRQGKEKEKGIIRINPKSPSFEKMQKLHQIEMIRGLSKDIKVVN